MEVDNNLVEQFKELNRENLEFIKKCAQLAQEITSGELTIVQLVEQLGVLLVDISPNNRELGIWILTHVLEGLPPNHFDEKQLNFICTFYIDRLKDNHQVIPAVISGILILTKFERFPNGAATQILSTLFHNISCQQQQEQDRRNIYKIFEILLDKHSTELCTMGLDYICGIISAVDGERNPKNLILLFNWFPKFFKTVNLSHLTEEAFEVVACYFPVDFKAPSNDPVSITRDQLANSLGPCLTAIPQFAEFCFPLALEKLESSLEIAKLDALKLLEIGCLSFETASYVQHGTELWSQIQREIFNKPNPIIEKACLTTLSYVIKKLSNDPNVNTTIKDISDTLKGNLLPDSKLFEPSAKLLLGVASASRISSDLITKEIAPILINTFNITTTPSHKILVLNNLVCFFISYVKLHNQIEFEDLNCVPILCLKASVDENTNLRENGFDNLSQISQFLPKDVRLSIYGNLRKFLLISQTEQVRKSILKCLDQLSENFPVEIQGEFVTNMEITSGATLEAYLDALTVLVAKNVFTSTVTDILLYYLKQDVILGQVVVRSLKNMLMKYEDNDRIQSVVIEKQVISTLVDWALGQEDVVDVECLNNVGFILKSIIGHQDADKQREIITNELTKIELSKSTHIFIIYGLLCNLKQDVQIDYEILNNITQLLMMENNDFIKNTAMQLLANLINKCRDENVLRNFLGQFDQNKTDSTLMSWITKALVMRNHEMANSWVDQLINLLDKDKETATSFRVIINDNFDCLSTKSYCVRTLLYQQKFFTVVSNKLTENYRPECSAYLLALGYLLESAPRKAILLQFNKILKLIILCLDECEEGDVVAVILQIIKEFIINKEKCIEDHVSDFLSRFLKLSTFNQSMKVRILALQCLQEVTTSFPIYKLLVHKQEVLLILGKTVDDKKRIVRREAVTARSLWYLLDAPM